MTKQPVTTRDPGKRSARADSSWATAVPTAATLRSGRRRGRAGRGHASAGREQLVERAGAHRRALVAGGITGPAVVGERGVARGLEAVGELGTALVDDAAAHEDVHDV